MKTTEFKEVFVEELKDIFSAESQLLKALPKIAKALTSPELIQAVQSHFEQTKRHAARLEEALKALGEDTKGPVCEAMKGILEEGSKLIEEIEKGPVRDTALIAGCQKVEHYEIASYGSVVTWATVLGFSDHAKTLQTTLEEEKAADDLLTEIAQVVNAQAVGSDAQKTKRGATPRTSAPKRSVKSRGSQSSKPKALVGTKRKSG